MHALAQWALPGIIFSSAIGALIICVLVLKYSFPSVAERGYTPPAELTRRQLATRLGHAAGICFAVSALFAVVVVVSQSRARAVGVPADRVALPDPRVTRLETEMRALEERLIRAESRLDAAESRAESAEMPSATVERRASPPEPSSAPAITGRRQRAEVDRQTTPVRRSPLVTERAVLPRESLPTAPSHVAVQREVAAPSATTQTARPREAARSAPSATTQTAPPREAARPAPSVVVAPREVPPPPAPSHDSAPASSVATPPRESIVSPASAPAAPREKTLPAPAAAVAPPRKEAGESARGDASSAQAPSETPSASAATHGSDTLDLKAKLRDDWQQIKRDATNVGGDVRGALRRFRDWLK